MMALALSVTTAGCVAPTDGPATVDGAVAPPAAYMGVETRLLDRDLVNIRARMGTGGTEEQVAEYAKCAAAQYALIRGFGFARHVRTNVSEEGGNWLADAVYTISPALPEGVRTIDAEVTVARCSENRIPTV